MGFPQTPLPVLVDIAPGADPGDDPDNWDALGLWTDITDDVRVADGIHISGGRADEANQVDTTKCTFRLDNRSGNYSPRNPLGIYYGALRKNTPVRVRIQRGQDSFGRTSSNSWGTADSGTLWNSTGSQYAVSPSTGATITWASANSQFINYLQQSGAWNSEVLVEVSIPSVPVGGVIRLGAVARLLASNNGCWTAFAEWQTDGTVDLRIARRSGAGSLFIVRTVDSAVTGYTANRKIWVRLRAVGNNIQGKLWYDGSAEPGAWQTTFTEPNVDLRYDTSTTELGANSGIYTERATGNSSPTSGNILSFETITSVFTGTVVEWPVRWDQSGNDATVPVEASGVIRRLSQGQSPLQSPIYKTIVAKSPYAYWPLEDGSGATTGQGIGPNVKPATVFGASFGYDGIQLGGSKSTVEVTQDMTVSALLPAPAGFTTANGWEVNFFFLTEALPPGGQPATVMSIFTGGSEVQWNLVISNDGTYGWRNINPDGTIGSLQTMGTGAIQANVWYGLRCAVYNVGGSITVALTYNNLSTGAHEVITWSIGGTVGYPKRWALYGSSTSYPAGSVGHVAFFANHGIFPTEPFIDAASGYAGETASDRIIRLCDEQGVPLTTLDDSTTLMGPQRSDTFLNLLRECETADLGVLYETPYAPGLGYRPRTARYSTAGRFTLNVSSGHLAAPPEPTDDDQTLRNDWTVSRANGGTVQVTDDVSITEQGRYDDSVEINVSSDDVLVDHASMRVYLGTLDDLRWPQVDLNLARNPNFASVWLSVLVGSRFVITNAPSQLTGITIDLVVEGFEQTLSPYGWDVTMNCSPAKAWSQFAPVAGTSVASTDPRLDSDVSFLNASITSSATSMAVVRPADTLAWDTTAPPFDLNVYGERMTCTAISGTGTTQTFTVTRGVNGFTKAHNAGEPVSLWLPFYVAL